MVQRSRILVIDDDIQIGEYLEDLLSSLYQIDRALTAEEALKQVRQQPPDLIILDIKLNEANGLDLCHLLRENVTTRKTPILIYSGSDDIEYLTAAFDRGADDYIAKTVRPRELIARVSAKLRGNVSAKGNSGCLRCGNLEIDENKIEARINGHPLQLSILEFNLLKYFVLNRERVVSRTQILEGVWKDSVVSNRTIDTHMVYLRKKLAGFDHVLATVYGAGYILREAPPASSTKTAATAGATAAIDITSASTPSAGASGVGRA